MGREKKAWLITFDEVRQRYENGESLAALADACGLSSYRPVSDALRAAGVPIRPRGGPTGPRHDHKYERKTVRCARSKCSVTFEVYPSSTKKYCSQSCRYRSDEQYELAKRNMKWVHTLSNVDASTLTADCGMCGRVKIRERRDKNRVHSDRPQYRCRLAEQARVWAREYGLSVEDIQQMLLDQGNSCGICQVHFSETFHVDHCHQTGAVRGLLCRSCNMGLGCLGDTLDDLRRAAAYLEAHDGRAVNAVT